MVNAALHNRIADVNIKRLIIILLFRSKRSGRQSRVFDLYFFSARKSLMLQGI